MTYLSRGFRPILLALLALILLCPAALAEGEKASFSVRPVRYDPNRPATQGYFIYDVPQAQVIQDEVLVRNTGNAAGTARLYAVDATTGQTSGTVFYSSADPRRGVGAWIALGEQEVTLGPGEERKVAFTVTVPASAEPGQHLGGIAAENVAVERGASQGALQVNLQTRAVTAVQVNLPGPVVEKITVTGITAGGEQGYQTLLVGLRNDGNQMAKPAGTLTITDAQGQEVQRLKLQLDTFLPRTEIQYPVFVERQALAAGQYQAKLDLAYGQGGATTYQSAVAITQEQVTQAFQGSQPLAPPAPASGAAQPARAGGWPIAPQRLALIVLVLAVAVAVTLVVLLLKLRRPQPAQPGAAAPAPRSAPAGTGLLLQRPPADQKRAASRGAPPQVRWTNRRPGHEH